jgi:ribosome recycling factor
MNPTQIVDETKQKMQLASDHFEDEIKKIRTGRAHAGMLDGIVVEAYGTTMPLNQLASVIAPESQLLQITPFDPSNLQAISTAIRNNQTLGFNPMDDGRVVRVPIPPLNEERRRQIVKSLGEKVEECMINLRNIRHDALKVIDQAKKDKQLGEDDQQRMEKEIDLALAHQKSAVEAASKTKETEILTI